MRSGPGFFQGRCRQCKAYAPYRPDTRKKQPPFTGGRVQGVRPRAVTGVRYKCPGRKRSPLNKRYSVVIFFTVYMKRFFISICVILCAGSQLGLCKRPEDASSHAVLLTLRSPQDMVYPCLPGRYTVPLALSG